MIWILEIPCCLFIFLFMLLCRLPYFFVSPIDNNPDRVGFTLRVENNLKKYKEKIQPRSGT